MTVEWLSSCVNRSWFCVNKNDVTKWKTSAPLSLLCVRRVREIPVKMNPSFVQHEQKAVQKIIVLTQIRRALRRGRFAKRTMRLEEVNTN